MDNLTLVAPCHFGVESVLKREILDLAGHEQSNEDISQKMNICIQTVKKHVHSI